MRVLTLADNITDVELSRMIVKYSKMVDDIVEDGEEWRIIGTSGRNWVSSLGRVKSYPYTFEDAIGRGRLSTGGLRSLTMNRDGYLNTQLEDFPSTLVHRMVATAFIPNPDDLPQINHIDFDVTNNAVTNLEWVSSKDNIAHTIKHGRRNVSRSQIDAMVAASIAACSVPITRLEDMTEYPSKRIASEKCNISIMSIDDSIKNVVTVKGMTFVLTSMINASFDVDAYTQVANANRDARHAQQVEKRSHKIRRVDTGEVYSSISEAGRQLNLDTDGIRRNLKKERPFHGILFEYVDR